MSLLSHTWTRVLVVEQVCSDDIFPTGGVGPGSAYAIFELAGYLVDDLEAVLGTYGSELALNIHVDDVAVRAVQEDKVKALEAFIGAGAMLVHRLEKEKGLKFAPSKERRVATERSRKANGDQSWRQEWRSKKAWIRLHSGGSRYQALQGQCVCAENAKTQEANEEDNDA